MATTSARAARYAATGAAGFALTYLSGFAVAEITKSKGEGSQDSQLGGGALPVAVVYHEKPSKPAAAAAAIAPHAATTNQPNQQRRVSVKVDKEEGKEEDQGIVPVVASPAAAVTGAEKAESASTSAVVQDEQKHKEKEVIPEAFDVVATPVVVEKAAAVPPPPAAAAAATAAAAAEPPFPAAPASPTIPEHIFTFDEQEKMRQQLAAATHRSDAKTSSSSPPNAAAEGALTFTRDELDSIVKERTAYEVRARVAGWREEIAQAMKVFEKQTEQLEELMDQHKQQAEQYAMAAERRAGALIAKANAAALKSQADMLSEVQRREDEAAEELKVARLEAVAEVRRRAAVSRDGARASVSFMMLNDCVETGSPETCDAALKFAKRLCDDASAVDSAAREQASAALNAIHADKVATAGVPSVAALRDSLRTLSRQVRRQRFSDLEGAQQSRETSNGLFELQRQAAERADMAAAQSGDEFAKADAGLAQNDFATAIQLVANSSNNGPVRGVAATMRERWLEEARSRMTIMNLRDASRVWAERSLVVSSSDEHFDATVREASRGLQAVSRSSIVVPASKSDAESNKK